MKLLDLYCCEGGAAMGYHRAGFDEIVGVDIKPQKRYPFQFVQGDALEYLRNHGHEFDAIHASPPCQAYTVNRHIHELKGANHPQLIEPTRDALIVAGKPWIMENVKGAPLNPNMTIWLKGTMFDLRVFRQRGFESNIFLMQPKPIKNKAFGLAAPQGRPVDEAHQYMVITGHFNQKDGYAKRAMGIDWMSRHGLAQSIPPAYTEFVGRQLIAYITHGSVRV